MEAHIVFFFVPNITLDLRRDFLGTWATCSENWASCTWQHRAYFDRRPAVRNEAFQFSPYIANSNSTESKFK